MSTEKQTFSIRKHCPKCRHELQRDVVLDLFWHGQAECDRCGVAIRYTRTSQLVVVAIVGCVFGVIGRAVFDLGIIELVLMSGLSIFLFQRFVDVLFDDLEVIPERTK